MKKTIYLFCIILLGFTLSAGELPPLRTFADTLLGAAIEKNAREAYLGWYAYYSPDIAKMDMSKKVYLLKIEEYLKANPQTPPDIADKMKKCIVVKGMSKNEVLAIARPTDISENTFLYYARIENTEESFSRSEPARTLKKVNYTRKVWLDFSPEGIVRNIDVLG